MANATKSTRSRRSTKTEANGSKPAPKRASRSRKAAPAAPKGEFNAKVVARRIQLIPDDGTRADLAKRFAAGEAAGKLATEVGLNTSQTAYAVRQQLVESGEVSRIDASDVDAVKACLTEQGLIWASCRTGLTPWRVKEIAA